MRRALWILAFCPAIAGCKKEPTCKPESVQWEVRLALGASPLINLNDEGMALPTAVRIYQLRGDMAVEDLDFDTVWTSEKAEDLGEAFLGVEELTVYPDRPEQRSLPLEDGVTHMVATGLFRQPAGNTWYTVYELPRLHPEVVCSKAPDTKVYPDPCFFLYVDRNALAGGPIPPPGFVPDESVKCAPLGVVPEPKGKKKRRRWRDRNKETLEDPLKTKEVEKKVPQTPQTPQPQTPNVPDTLPNAPQKPSVPPKPTAPKLPGTG
jgi:type VI secretion system VasD/TssJ family lipoprotein